MTQQTLNDWLSEGPFDLSMSSGFFGFFAHTGFLRALEERGHRPARVTGSSAGALVGGCYAAGISPSELGDELLHLERRDFWDPHPGLGLLRGQLFRDKLTAMLPATTFDGCQIPLAMSSFDILGGRTVILDQGDLAGAIHASCTVPGLFHPARVAGRWYWDGGIFDRPGILGARLGKRILFHHLASKSPWRRRAGAAMQIPTAPNLVTLAIDALPRVGPFALEAGGDAMAMAYDKTHEAFDRPVVDGIVTL